MVVGVGTPEEEIEDLLSVEASVSRAGDSDEVDGSNHQLRQPPHLSLSFLEA